MKKESEWQQGGGSGSVDWDRHQRAEAPRYALSSCAFGSLWDFGDTGYQFSVVGWETPARAVSSFRSAVPAVSICNSSPGGVWRLGEDDPDGAHVLNLLTH